MDAETLGVRRSLELQRKQAIVAAAEDAQRTSGQASNVHGWVNGKSAGCRSWVATSAATSGGMSRR